MPENQKQVNQELNKTSKLNQDINKQLKEGASLSKALQDNFKKLADSILKGKNDLSGLNSESKKLQDKATKTQKTNEKDDKYTAKKYKKAFQLNKSFKEQVGLADKMAAKMKQGLNTDNARQKLYQDLKSDVRAAYSDAPIELQQTQLDQVKRLREETRNLSNDQMSRMMTNQRLAEIDDAILATNEDLFKAKAKDPSSQTAKILEDQLQKQYEIRDLSAQTSQEYDKIGTESFQQIDTAEKRAEIERQMEKIGRRYWGNNAEYGERLKEQYKDSLKILDTIDAQNDHQDNLNRQVKGASAFITGPFEKLSTILKSMPAGDLISDIVGVDKAMEKFTEATRENLTKALDSKNFADSEQAVQAIGDAGMEAANKMMEGFKNVFKLIMSNPAILLTAALVASAGALSMIYDGALETRKELGVTFGEAAKLQSTINLTAMSFKLLGVTGEDVKGITDGIRQNLGGTTQPSAALVKGFTNLVATTGITGENVTTLATQMMAVGAASEEAAMAQMESVAALARANGVAPGDILNDIASDTDLFAGFAQDGGRNLAMAAITAKKLGLEMATVGKMTDSLLDFETSVNAQMEASMLTGRSINTDKAREMALAGDLEGMQREITSQIGSAADFEKMNVVQRKALAQAFGVSVGELGKMITNQDKINNMTESEKVQRDLIAAGLKFVGEAMSSLLSLAKAMIPVFAVLGVGIAIAFYPITLTVAGLIALGKLVQVVNEKFGMIGGTLLTLVGLAGLFAAKMAMGSSKAMESVKETIKSSASSIKDKIKSKAATTSAEKTGQAGNPMGFMEKVDGKKLIQGAGAMLIASAALFVTAKALQEFNKVSFGSIVKGGIALLGLTGIMALIGKLQGQLIQGATAMLIMSVGLIPFAFGLQMLSKVDYGQILKAGVALVGLTGAMFLLGTLLAGPGAIIFGAGVLGLVALGGAMVILGVGLAAVGAGISVIGMGLGMIVSQISILSELGGNFTALSASFVALGASMASLAVGALAMVPALPVLGALTKLGIIGGGNVEVAQGGDEEGENPIETLLREQNTKLETIVARLGEDGPIAKNTRRGAEESKKFSSLVTMA